MNPIERFDALPRARRGDTTVVIAPEAELLSIIADAQVSEASLARTFRSTTAHDDPPPGISPSLARVIDKERRDRMASKR